jgi:hypothetical protein
VYEDFQQKYNIENFISLTHGTSTTIQKAGRGLLEADAIRASEGNVRFPFLLASSGRALYIDSA